MKTMLTAAAALIAAIIGPAAPAAPQSAIDAPAKALGDCMVLKTTGADRLLAARWILVVLASGPQAKDLVTVAPGKKEELDKGMAALFTRLMVNDCANQSRALFGTGDLSGFRIAGGALGRVAMQELLANPQAEAALSEYTKYLNRDDFKSVMAK
jgi:hypothetical protein